MSREPLSTIRQLELMRDLQRLADERAAEETLLRDALDQGLAEVRQKFSAEREQIDAQWEAARAVAETEHDRQRTTAEEAYQEELQATQHEYKGIRSEVELEHSQETETAQKEKQESAWQALTMFEVSKGGPRERFQQAARRLRRSTSELKILERDAATIMRNRRVRPPGLAQTAVNGAQPPGPASPSAGDADVELAVRRVMERVTASREITMALYRQKVPRLFESWHPAAILGLFIAVGALVGWLIGRSSDPMWVVVLGGSIALVGGILFLALLYPRARQMAITQFTLVQQSLSDARQAIQVAEMAARARGARESEAMVKLRDAELADADHRLATKTVVKDQWKTVELGQANELYPARLVKLRSTLQNQVALTEQKYQETLATIAEKRDVAHHTNQEQFDRQREDLECENRTAWQTVEERWFAGLDRIGGSWREMEATCQRFFPTWANTRFDSWTMPETPPEAIRFGEIELPLAHIKNGQPTDPRLMPLNPVFHLPALMALEQHPVMVIEAEGPGRQHAIDLLQLVMLRMLTGMPAGKIRFTILDPVGLGEHFSSFMHLADFDERLIASRIWTETKQISDQLIRLTSHMETILQKYLRNEFATIHDYNLQADEVAEPFQVLVAANFPANFTEESARRLVSIATSGPRCGVYTLVGIDGNQQLPNDFPRKDLLANAVHLQWQGEQQRFRWLYPALEKLQLTIDPLPPREKFVEVVRAAGQAAKHAIRVEVPFDVVAPAENQRWHHDCSSEFVVPVGRAGATRLQSVRLGKGTSQHVLICGKTGSGKSTFLHALITNAALHYSPNEVELYLIDFKKGVEFKAYATGQLPHARVIAIESEREFGLSVLERLDLELRRRGDLYRSAGAQDLSSFRAACPDQTMPRVLLIVDEFQELFVEDDRLSQEAALLLDRLVRQGRAFGMHVLLGSQTLSGAYSLARSTMGQMAVRIALQCSEADAHLILNDDRNVAARYLSRPGEAIYNDQNGLVTGNHPFQVVWLGEQQRLDRLAEVTELQEQLGQSMIPPIVFEGNTPADPADNELLCDLLDAPPGGPPPLVQKAWLGAAVAIKDPTSATFARHAGSNLLVVGHREEAALGVLTSAVVSLAVQGKVETADPDGDRQQAGDDQESQSGLPLHSRFVILDGTRPESPEVGMWQKVVQAIPVPAQLVGLRDGAGPLNAVRDELERRESLSEEQPPLFLVIHNAGRFRELRRKEDDFSFSTDRDKPPAPDKQLAEILRNGPAFGIHTLIWCDSYNNVARLFDRMTLREFEMRVVFQMSAADSSNLIDSPAATKLVTHRGLFYSDELGTTEKFRPYGVPTDPWLERVRQTLST